jgi:hypothetical protein
MCCAEAFPLSVASSWYRAKASAVKVHLCEGEYGVGVLRGSRLFQQSDRFSEWMTQFLRLRASREQFLLRRTVHEQQKEELFGVVCAGPKDARLFEVPPWRRRRANFAQEPCCFIESRRCAASIRVQCAPAA